MSPRPVQHPLSCPQSDRYFADAFAELSVMVILRGMDVERTVALAGWFWDMGVSLVEVPVGSAQARQALAATVAAGHARSSGSRDVGAGTVRSAQEVAEVAEAGAAFTVSPGWDREVVAASLHAGLPHLSGVMTPTEVHRASQFGLNWLKLFPASVLGPGHISALHGPFPGVHLVATGGIDPANARDYLAAGAAAVSFGSSAARASRAEFTALRHDIASDREHVSREDQQ